MLVAGDAIHARVLFFLCCDLLLMLWLLEYTAEGHSA